MLLLLLLTAQDAAESFFESVRFEDARADTVAGDRVAELLRSKEHWVAAYRAIEAKLGPMPPVALTVSFDHQGEEAAQARASAGRGHIRFNLKKLEEYQGKIDELEERKRALAREGKRLVFKVSPARVDRVIWHELVHVFHADYEAPKWFTEGLAQWLSEDASAVQGFAHARRETRDIEAELAENRDVYARGHLFWSWVASRGAVRRAVRASVIDGRPWKEALEEALGLPWNLALGAERDWSAREVERIRSR